MHFFFCALPFVSYIFYWLPFILVLIDSKNILLYEDIPAFLNLVWDFSECVLFVDNLSTYYTNNRKHIGSCLGSLPISFLVFRWIDKRLLLLMKFEIKNRIGLDFWMHWVAFVSNAYQYSHLLLCHLLSTTVH